MFFNNKYRESNTLSGKDSDNRRRKFFDYHATDWDKNYPPEVIEKAKDILSALPINTGDTILDLGCGTGILYPVLQDINKGSGVVYGMDFSRKMLSEASLAYPAGSLICATSNRLPFRNSCFDRVIAFAAFPHFSDKRQVCTEVYRILKAAGYFCVVHLLSSEEIKDHHYHAGEEVKNDLLPAESEFRKMLTEAGFEDISIEDSAGRYILIARKNNNG
ncbi:MAG: methyltransferase domain-containing protein [candidate division Zixibacteria bacterium]|nr:methyltransferase domain-containing protein [candidate division Zixibacteria bacterium]